jgi:hypothetical protein
MASFLAIFLLYTKSKMSNGLDREQQDEALQRFLTVRSCFSSFPCPFTLLTLFPLNSTFKMTNSTAHPPLPALAAYMLSTTSPSGHFDME